MYFYLARVDAGASPAASDSVLGKEGRLQIFSRAPGYLVRLSIRPPRCSNTDEACGFSVGNKFADHCLEPVEAPFRKRDFRAPPRSIWNHLFSGKFRANPRGTVTAGKIL